MLNHVQLLNRRAPFGYNIIESLRELPQYELTVAEVKVTGGGYEPVQIELSVGCSATIDGPAGKRSKKLKGRSAGGSTYVLTTSSDLEFIDFRRIPYVTLRTIHINIKHKTYSSTKALQETKTFPLVARLEKPSQTIVITISSVPSDPSIWTRFSTEVS